MLKINDVSKLLGVSQQSIRRYEELGMLDNVETNKSNRYRSYSIASINVIMRILFFKSMGFGTKKIKKLQQTDQKSEIIDVFRLRQEEIRRQMDREAKIIDKLSDLTFELEHFEDNRIELGTSPDFYFIPFFDSEDLIPTLDREYFRQWIDEMPLVNSAPYFERDAQGNYNNSFGYGLMVLKKHVANPALTDERHVCFFPAGPAIHFYVRCSILMGDALDLNRLSFVFEFAEKHRLTLGSIIGRTLITYDRSLRRNILHEFWALIKNGGG